MAFTRYTLLIAAVILTACAGAPPISPPPTAPAVATVARQPITVESPLSKVFGLAAGAQWIYETNRTDECIGRGVSKTARGAITETVTSAWQLEGAQVFELRVESCLLGEQLEKTEYYVVLDNTLYRTASPPEMLIQARGRGYEAMLLATWPATIGQTFGTSNRGAWRVLDQSPVDWAEGQADGCTHLRRRSTNNEEEIWFCEGLGIVKHVIRESGERINAEEKSLKARTSAARF
ncbi:MAG: hypothetical protein ACUVRU_08980 [Anaerolineae bacterium]